VERITNTMYLLTDILKGAWAGDNHSGIARNDAQQMLCEQTERADEKFTASVDDDFNTAGAIAAVFELVRQVNIFVNSGSFARSDMDCMVLAKACGVLTMLCNVLGILEQSEKYSADDSLVEELMQLILDIRQQARAKKDWSTADSIRDGLSKLGIVVEDTPQGPRWKKA